MCVCVCASFSMQCISYQRIIYGSVCVSPTFLASNGYLNTFRGGDNELLDALFSMCSISYKRRIDD
jgi:hypothetical protein